MDWLDVLEQVLTAAVGSSALAGAIICFARRGLEKRITEKEQRVEKERELRIRRRELDAEVMSAYGSLLFWLYRAVTTGSHNGELEKAMQTVVEAEKKKEELDRQTISGQCV